MVYWYIEDYGLTIKTIDTYVVLSWFFLQILNRSFYDLQGLSDYKKQTYFSFKTIIIVLLFYLHIE